MYVYTICETQALDAVELENAVSVCVGGEGGGGGEGYV